MRGYKCPRCRGLVGEERYTQDLVCLSCGWRRVKGGPGTSIPVPAVDTSLPQGSIQALVVNLDEFVTTKGQGWY